MPDPDLKISTSIDFDTEGEELFISFAVAIVGLVIVDSEEHKKAIAQLLEAIAVKAITKEDMRNVSRKFQELARQGSIRNSNRDYDESMFDTLDKQNFS